MRYIELGYIHNFIPNSFLLVEPGILDRDIKLLNEKYKYRFLEMPIVIRIEFSNKKIRPFLEAGISTNFLISGTLETRIEKEGKIEQLEKEIGYRKITPVSLISIGLNHKLRDN